MSAETDFLNYALGAAGYDSITGIDDGSSSANWCKVFYPQLRKIALATHFWNFAEDRAELALTTPAPIFEYSNAFTLPAELIRIKVFNGVTPVYIPNDPTYWMYYPGRWKVEGRRILTNDTSVKIVFVKDIDNPALWDPLFFEMLAKWLGSLLAMSIGKDNAKSTTLLQQAIGISMPLAAAVDGQSGDIQPYSVPHLIIGRR